MDRKSESKRKSFTSILRGDKGVHGLSFDMLHVRWKWFIRTGPRFISESLPQPLSSISSCPSEYLDF